MPPAFLAPASGYVDVDGPVHVADYGGGPDGPTLVALHGLGGSHLNWSAVAPALTGRGRLLAPDLVGHGLTPHAGRPADIDGHVRLVAGLIDALGTGPVVLVGNSMGGLVAALVAGRHPGAVCALVLVDPAVPVGAGTLVSPRSVANLVACGLPGAGECYVALRRLSTPEQTVRRVLWACCADPSRVAPEVVAAHVALVEASDRRSTDAAYLRSARSLVATLACRGVVARELDRIAQPTLLLHGRRDRLVPLAAVRATAARHPAWRFEVAADAGHVPMLERPDWTADRVADWLDGPDGRARSRPSGVAGSAAPGGPPAGGGALS